MQLQRVKAHTIDTFHVRCFPRIKSTMITDDIAYRKTVQLIGVRLGAKFNIEWPSSGKDVGLFV